jgi:hypothetical protein
MGDRSVIRIRKEDFKKPRVAYPRQKEEAFKDTEEKRKSSLSKKGQWMKFVEDEDDGSDFDDFDLEVLDKVNGFKKNEEDDNVEDLMEGVNEN